ncbi:hypothetical protein AR685_09355 [Chryseobacterium sp. JAH]|nr:hypothetical protein AR685_09355 [Chryseobacterium sp. JAH]
MVSSQDRPMEDYTIAKRVNVSNNYNTGQPNINIPLYKVESGSLTVSSLLKYTNNLLLGEPSMVGTNWDINLFGKIIMKESQTYLNGIAGLQNNGFYTKNSNTCFVKENNTTITKKQMLTNPTALIDYYYPNEFYFEFLGYHGTFLSDNVGNILVQSESGEFKVTFNGQKCYNIYAPINNALPEIIMEDTNGNKFYFGGDYNSVDINYVSNKYQYENMNNNGGGTSYTAYRNINYVNGFYLKRVELNNGRTIDAFYRNGNRAILDPFTNGGYYFGNNYSFVFPSKTALADNNLFLGKDIINNKNFNSNWSTSTSFGFSTNKTDTYYKIALLDSLKISDFGTVNFLYQDINNSLTKPFLKKIQVKASNRLIDNIDLNYKIKDGRVFLENTKVNQKNYFFDYYNYTSGQNKITSQGGLIRTVTHPTSGFDFFVYEQNTASKIHGFNGNNDYFLNDIQNTAIPGQRLKEITTSDTNGSNSIKKKYSYKYESGLSSGITSAKRISSSGDASDPLALFSSDGDGGYYESLYNADVSYSKVTEEITNKEKSEFFFTDLVSNPDSLDVNTYASYSPASYLGVYKQYITKSIERGKLYKTNKYDFNNNLVFQENISYKNFLNNAYLKKEISNNCLDCKITDYKYYIRASKNTNPLNPQQYAGFYSVQPVLPYLPAKITTKELASGSTFLESIKKIEYNDNYLYWHQNPIKITSNNIGRTNVKNIFYPGDLLKASNCYSPNCNLINIDNPGKKLLTYKQMIDNNIILPVLVIDKNHSNKYSLTESIYNKLGNTNKYRIASQRVNNLSSFFSESNFENAEVFEIEKFDLYDSKGNLIQLTQNSGIPITTIWGYHQTKPIAKIVGASYSQLMQFFNLNPNDSESYLQLEIVKKSNLDINDLTENALISELNIFQRKSELKDFQITSYVYDPLIGMKTIIPPYGIDEKYRYDSQNRLERILDNNGKIVQEYKYNYVPLSTPPTTFYNAVANSRPLKKNCSPGYDSETYIYTVPAEVYSSTISQMDADQKAIDDVNSNGQYQANQNLVCKASECSFTPIGGLSLSSFQPVIYNEGVYVHFNVRIQSQGLNPSSFSSGRSLGIIGGNCHPINTATTFTFNEPPGGAFGDTPANRTWEIRVDTFGNVSAKLLSGSIVSSYYNYLNFSFHFLNLH